MNASQIMHRAHEIARTLEGDYRARLSYSLREAHREARLAAFVPAHRVPRSRKSIAQSLDVAAQRADYIDQAPATSKQCWYLAGLLHANGENELSVLRHQGAPLTRREASQAISYYASH